jgi:adenylate cyclase
MSSAGQRVRQLIVTLHSQWMGKMAVGRFHGLTLVSGTDLKQRLVAILAADAAGYSRLMSLDGRGTVAALDAARQVFRLQVESNHGRVIDMAGDSVLAVFDTATGAVIAALAVQVELAALAADVGEERRMQFRIGIHLGDVMEKADGSVYGDGVNIAARLQALAEPGQITVSDAVHGVVRGKVSVNFADLGEQTVKNITHPVRAYRAQVAAVAKATIAELTKPLVAAGDLSLPDKPSVAVLPFTNMSGDPQQEYFADGITEDIITELSRFNSLFVVARNSSFVFRGRSVDIREVGSRLGVGYVLEGSVRRAGNRIRVTAQLITSSSGAHVWADRFDDELTDVFAVQDEIARTIVSTIVGRVEDYQSARKLQISSCDLSAYDQVLRGQKYFHDFTSLSYERASACFRAAIAADAGFARARSLLAVAEVYRWFWDDEPSRLQHALGFAADALALDPHDSRGTMAMGVAQLFRMNHDQAEHHLTHACELNPNDDLAILELGRMRMYCGQPEVGAELVRKAMRRNPFHANWYWNILGRCLHSAGNFEAAIPVFESVTTPQFWTHAYLAACYTATGNHARAQTHRDLTLAMRPGFGTASFSAALPYRDKRDLQRYIGTLRAAGLPD